MNRRNAIIGALSIFLCFTAAHKVIGQAAADSSSQSKQQAITLFKQLRGTVSAISHNGIAVEHPPDDTGADEMYLPFDKNLRDQIKGRAISLYQTGDKVLVLYRETVLKDEKGMVIKSERVAFEIDPG